MSKEIHKLTEEILRCFPKLFDDFKGWEYGNGTSAAKDFKRIYNRARRINKQLTTKQK